MIQLFILQFAVGYTGLELGEDKNGKFMRSSYWTKFEIWEICLCSYGLIFVMRQGR